MFPLYSRVGAAMVLGGALGGAGAKAAKGELKDLLITPTELKDTINGIKTSINKNPLVNKGELKTLEVNASDLPASRPTENSASKSEQKTIKNVNEQIIAREVNTESLPNYSKAVIPDEKIVGYALNTTHIDGKHKARVFESALGYNATNYEKLIEQINTNLPYYKAVIIKKNEHGQHLAVDMVITGVNGKTANVRTGWIIKSNSDIPRLTTMFVKDKGGSK